MILLPVFFSNSLFDSDNLQCVTMLRMLSNKNKVAIFKKKLIKN